MTENMDKATLKTLFLGKIKELENSPYDDICVSIKIHPTIKYLFTGNSVFGDAFDPADIEDEDCSVNSVGQLDCCEVKIVKNLKYLAKFIGASGESVTIPRPQVKKHAKSLLPDCSLKYLEI